MTYFALVCFRLGLATVGHVNSTACTLDERSHTVLHGKLHPLIEVQVQDEHLVEVGAVLGLTAVHDHTLKVHARAVVLAGDHGEAFGFEHIDMHLIDIQDDHLVGALAHLTLLVEHEAAAKREDFIEISNRRVALSALDSIGAGRVRDAFPGDVVADHFRLGDFPDRLVVQPADEERAEVAGDDGGALAGRGRPLGLLGGRYIDAEAFSFLCPLDKGLQTSSQLLDQLVARDVVGRVGRELRLVILVR